jgi:hypothetical protein
MRYAMYEGKRRLEGERGAQTNDLGEFRVFGLKKGRYFVSARTSEEREPPPTASNRNDEASSENSGYAPVYYPGTPDVARASPIEVMTGQEVPGIDFTLIPVRTFRVRGHVFDATIGQPVKDCFVILMHRDPNRYGFSGERATAGCDKGTFEFRSVPPGSYNLFALIFGSGKQRTARTSLEVENANVTDVAVTFVRGPDLTGRILIEGREAVDFSELHVWLSDPEQYFNGGANAVAKSDGTVTLENIPEGNYDTDVGGLPSSYSADFYTKDVRVNGESILNRGLTIAAGSTRGSLEIVLSSEGTRIDGTVTDETDLPAAGAVVALVPEEALRKQFRLYKNATTDQYGKFILRGIAPGKYKLFAWKEVEDNTWQDPDFLKPVEDQGTEITAEKNGRISIQLKVIASNKVNEN